MIGPGFVIDVSAAAAEDVDYQVGAADIEAFEAEHGPIPEGAIVLINTGRAGLYADREAYMGTAERGEEAVAKLHFPGLGKPTGPSCSSPAGSAPSASTRRRSIMASRRTSPRTSR